MCPVVVLSVLLFPLTVLLALSVQQAVSSPPDGDSQARLLPLNPGPVEDQTVMEERISKLMSLFNLQSPETTTAVVFGLHTRYSSRYDRPDLSILYYSILILQIFTEHSNRET